MFGRIQRSIKILRYKLNRLALPNSPSASTTAFWEYVKWYRWTRFTPPFPKVIDIQTKSGCNANCVFCNVGQEKNKIHGTMSFELWKKIIDEIMLHDDVLRIHPYLLNDPLVDSRISEKIEYLSRKKKKNTPKVNFITNAGLLDDEMAYSLLHTQGIDEFDISFNSIQKDVYEKAMTPLKYEKVMNNILNFKKKWDDFKGRKPKINIWTVRTKEVEKNLKNEKAYWRKVGIGFKARKLDNRGSEDVEKLGLVEREFIKVKMCPIPFWRAWIMWNGDMIMCCVDQERSVMLGNCADNSIHEIWNGPRYQKLRKKWREKRLEGLLCENCKGT